MSLLRDEYFAFSFYCKFLQLCDKSGMGLVLLKVLPKWLATLLYKVGVIDYLSSYTKWSTMNTQEYVNGLTKNEKLRAVLLYCYGDYGVYA